jgi:hypothetical protein
VVATDQRPGDEPTTETQQALTQPITPGRWMSGALGSATDNDYYTFPLSAGDTVFGSLDLDPERDGD